MGTLGHKIYTLNLLACPKIVTADTMAKTLGFRSVEAKGQPIPAATFGHNASFFCYARRHSKLPMRIVHSRQNVAKHAAPYCAILQQAERCPIAVFRIICELLARWKQ